MPTVARPDVLKATYNATLSLIQARQLPTLPIAAGRTVFRSVPVKYLPKPTAGKHVSKLLAAGALVPRDGGKEGNNRFSGPSDNGSAIPAAGGLYCVLQQQALVNELMHYTPRGTGKPPVLSFAESALLDKCIIKIVFMRQALVADLSPHNPGLEIFMRKLEGTPGLLDLLARTQYSSTVSLWQRLTDSDDCSVARGIGLAVAHTPFLSGLSVQTVRHSGRSTAERGDNLVLYGHAGLPVPGVYVEEAYYFDRGQTLNAFPVQFS